MATYLCGWIEENGHVRKNLTTPPPPPPPPSSQKKKEKKKEKNLNTWAGAGNAEGEEEQWRLWFGEVRTPATINSFLSVLVKFCMLLWLVGLINAILNLLHRISIEWREPYFDEFFCFCFVLVLLLLFWEGRRGGGGGGRERERERERENLNCSLYTDICETVSFKLDMTIDSNDLCSLIQI